ncbi:hypothetical protein [Spongiivirga citrea]|uniref:DUF4251 domain-containing protein n=1 Tax=Spongiivirga citrea TaxID=1481457 RepID=A0A6M0CRI9_9FLAO|nr:hypothetical protein [Spongiivirga citrea]NER18694.1 hypothetical protein [Spongiivirga citrea]
MKTIFLGISLFVSFIAHGQIVLDDFSTGPMSQKKHSTIAESKLTQSGSNILNNQRDILVKIKKNDDKQLILSKIEKGRMVISMGYNITGAIELRYGYDRTKPLNLNLSKYKSLNIEYEAKSNFGRVYTSMFSNGPNRAFWRGGGNRTLFEGKERGFTLKIPLVELQKAQDNKNTNAFTIKDVDHIKIQFLAQNKRGLNFTIKNIYFE